MKKYLFHSFLFFFLSFSVKSQQLLPFVENFTKTEYNGDNQVWSACQGNDNAIYFANNHFFLRYNGVKWEKYTLPNKTIIRSVFADGDKIYCGSYNEFGYWHRENGEMIYISLTKDKKLFTGVSNNEEIWKIFKFNNQIYFQSFNEIFILKGNVIEKIRIPFQVSYFFPLKNKLFVASVTNGIYLLKNKKFEKLNSWNALQNTVIHSIDFNNQNTYVFTKKKGVFIDNNGVLSAWNHPINTLLKSELIITARFIDTDRLVIGTAFKGVYIVDLKNNKTININRNNSLKNNSILSIGIDKENDLWLGMDNGIAHVEINSPFSVFSDNSGVLGSVYAISPIKNGYLLGSNHGLFKYENSQLSFVENSQGQVWDINKVDVNYLIGHNDGTFLYQNSDFKKINSINGGWQLLKNNFDKNYFMAHYSGIVSFEDLTFSNFSELKGLKKPIKSIAQNKADELWAVDNYKSLYKIKFKPNYEVEKIENITKSNGISNDYEVKMFNYKNQLFFLIHKTWYNYNSITNKLESNAIFNKLFNDISQIIAVNDSQFVILKNGLFYLITQKNDVFNSELIPEKYYKGKIVNQDTKVYQFGKELIINLDDGFFVFKPNTLKLKLDKVTIEGFYQGKLISDNLEIEHNQSIDLNVITSYYGYNRLTLFYKLNDSNELIPILNGNINLNNLSSGNQEIRIYYSNGKEYKQIATYEFNVSRAWYFSFWMIVFYIILSSLLLFLYYRWNKIRYIEKIKLKEEELKHQKEILQLELDAENKLKIQEYEKHILEIQVQTKASEVAGKSLSIAKQTEMIEGIQNILNEENNLQSIKTKISKVIKINSLNKNEWKEFELNLFSINQDFVKKLTSLYFNLSPKDIKLCIYLKMNLSSKEVAQLMNISYRGVELHRYRLRKKIELSTEENLVKFLMNL